MSSSTSHTQSGHTTPPFETTGNEPLRNTTPSELRPLKGVPVSDGLLQRIIASYEPDLHNFQPNVLLAQPGQPKPSVHQTRALLAHMGEYSGEGLVNAGRLMEIFPPKDSKQVEMQLHSFSSQDNANQQLLDVYDVLADHFARKSGLPIDEAFFGRLFDRYGKSPGSIFQLVADLQALGVDDKLIGPFAAIIHGWTKVRALAGYMTLEVIARQDPHKWDKRTAKFLPVPCQITADEAMRISNLRSQIGLPDYGKQQQTYANTGQSDGQQGSSPPYTGPQADREASEAEPEQENTEKGFYGATDQGRVRKTNEDSFWISADGSALVVADGMGGHNAGEVASGMIVKGLSEKWDNLKKYNGDGLFRELNYALEDINDEISRIAIGDQSGMGSTVALSVVKNNELYVASVGDSRAYLLRGNSLEQLTVDDHEAGHTQNVLSQAMGTGAINIHKYQKSLQPGDTILLCTDGLTNMVGEDWIGQVLRSHSPQKAVEKLIRGANHNGGHDNITAIVRRI